MKLKRVNPTDRLYSRVTRDVILFYYPNLKSHQSYYLHQASEGVLKFTSVNNVSAQEHASSKNRHVLNFRVMGVHDIKL